MTVQTRELYRNPNGDAWFLARNSDVDRVFIRHEPNRASGGRPNDTEIGVFLREGGQGSEKQELLRLIGGLVDGDQLRNHHQVQVLQRSRSVGLRPSSAMVQLTASR